MVALRTDSAPSTYTSDICARFSRQCAKTSCAPTSRSAPEIPVLGCYVSRNGVRADSEKISSICSWPTPKNQTELRQWLGLANYLHKYTKDYAGLIQPMSSLLKKAVAWEWRTEHQDAFDAVKKSLASAPDLMPPTHQDRSRRPDYDPRRLTRHKDIPDDDDDEDYCATCVTLGMNATVTGLYPVCVTSPVLPLRQQIADAYEEDAFYAAIIRYLRKPKADTLAKLTRPTRDTITRYDLDGDLLTYAIDTVDPPRVVIPADDDLRARLVHDPHAAPGPTLGGGGWAPTSQSVRKSTESPLSQSATSSAQDTRVEGHAIHGVAYEESLAVDAAAPAASIVTTANFAPKPTPTPIDSVAVSELLPHRQADTRFVRDAHQVAVDRQKANADQRGRKNMSSFRRGERVLLSTDAIQGTAVTNLGASELAPRLLGRSKF
ncbi:unnamed protein product [Phytophthora fragariaefolia]|uniref:Unnamed protein product n=1 Tax=Phytophthora fragariaefolia TaxID=1490495 RepID=A0A9W6U9H4_9STRA|nr:unnamed protein product [Phytophthora fragariaefolia]